MFRTGDAVQDDNGTVDLDGRKEYMGKKTLAPPDLRSGNFQ
jgi:hypothetical protein